MSKEYHPVKVGKSGTKVHAGEITGYSKKGHYSQPQPIYNYLCTRVNSHYINRPIGVMPLPAGTEITCQDCLRQMAEAQ